MLAVPSALQAQFEEYLRNKAIPNRLQGEYKSGKYHFPPVRPESLPRFIRKLQEKKQTKAQQEQTETAITMYYQIVKSIIFSNKEPIPQPTPPSGYSPFNDEKRLSFREVPARPVQYQKVIPIPSQGFAPLSRRSGSSLIVECGQFRSSGEYAVQQKKWRSCKRFIPSC